MPRGGKRTPKDGKKIGRPKTTRPVDGNVARKIKQKVDAERLWIFLIHAAAKKAKDTGNTADLRNALEYLDNRDWGNTVDTVNHLHDKPIEHNVNVTYFEVIERARKRATEK
jgi:hypothetical protein